MMSRITLSLRKYSKPDEDGWLRKNIDALTSVFQPGPRLPSSPISPGYRSTHGAHFGSQTLQVNTYAQPSSDMVSEQSDATRHVQFSSNLASIPGPVSLSRTPAQTFVEWTLGVGGYSRRNRRSAQSSGASPWVEGEPQHSQHVQEGIESESEEIELDEVKGPKERGFREEV
jgi:hypothetical protein